jgi:hypothetical protein
LLHSIAYGVIIVFGLDEREREMLIVEYVIGALGLAARDQSAAHDDTAFGEANSPTNLRGFVLPGLYDGGGNVFGADIGFAQGLLVHPACRWRVEHALRRLENYTREKGSFAEDGKGDLL